MLFVLQVLLRILKLVYQSLSFVLIFIHEFGHFLGCRLFNIEVFFVFVGYVPPTYRLTEMSDGLYITPPWKSYYSDTGLVLHSAVYVNRAKAIVIGCLGPLATFLTFAAIAFWITDLTGLPMIVIFFSICGFMLKHVLSAGNDIYQGFTRKVDV